MKVRRTLKVIPNSPRTESAGYMADGVEKIRIHAEREGGKANQELLRYMTEREGGSWKIVGGATSSKKILEHED